jgi:hypothetical protein
MRLFLPQIEAAPRGITPIVAGAAATRKDAAFASGDFDRPALSPQSEEPAFPAPFRRKSV